MPNIIGASYRSNHVLPIFKYFIEAQPYQEYNNTKQIQVRKSVMIKAEFGIIDKIDITKDYSGYEPETYGCIWISDDEYIDSWQPALSVMQTYFHNMDRPATGLARWGVTLIPPKSLPAFQDIVLSDPRLSTDENLVLLADKIREAIRGGNYMIHYGV